jgi:nicotinamidase-related amidase
MPVEPTIVGRPVLLVIDIQQSAFMEGDPGIPHMPDYRARMERALDVVAGARRAEIPCVFLQEAHRRSMIDYGRELDGTEGVHCLEGEPGTPLAGELGIRPQDPVIRKRRYSAFFGTDLEIVLKGLGARTLILVGGMTDVCVHYSFVDGHQHDYHCRVVSDAVGGTSQAAHDASLAAMEYLQTGAVLPAERILAEMGSLRAAA